MFYVFKKHLIKQLESIKDKDIKIDITTPWLYSTTVDIGNIEELKLLNDNDLFIFGSKSCIRLQLNNIIDVAYDKESSMLLQVDYGNSNYLIFYADSNNIKDGYKRLYEKLL